MNTKDTLVLAAVVLALLAAVPQESDWGLKARMFLCTAIILCAIAMIAPKEDRE
jgi:hypothetical protein